MPHPPRQAQYRKIQVPIRTDSNADTHKIPHPQTYTPLNRVRHKDPHKPNQEAHPLTPTLSPHLWNHSNQLQLVGSCPSLCVERCSTPLSDKYISPGEMYWGCPADCWTLLARVRSLVSAWLTLWREIESDAENLNRKFVVREIYTCKNFLDPDITVYPVLGSFFFSIFHSFPFLRT